jgi:hypothetical protein
MSGYCPDCGNTMCLCKDIEAQADDTNEAEIENLLNPSS